MTDLIIIGGPTATGKTALGVHIAKHFDGEVISADSMQIYKTMDIGTASPTPEETQGIAHHLISEMNPDEDYNVALFKEKATQAIEGMLRCGKQPIVVGGTGLYISALLYNYDLGGKKDEQLRAALQKQLAEEGNEAMHALLADLDAKRAANIHPNNTQRLLRALEMHYTQSTPKPNENMRYNPIYIVLTYEPRAVLYERINLRVDKMLEQGLLQEAHDLYIKGYDKSRTSLQAIGYKELFDYFDKITDLPTAVARIKQRSRNLAKRQLTWFAKDANARFFSVNAYENNEIFYREMIHFIEERTAKKP